MMGNSMDIDKIAKTISLHGKEMYCLALEHAISMIEIGGEGSLPILRRRIEEEKSSIESLRGEDGHADQ